MSKSLFVLSSLLFLVSCGGTQQATPQTRLSATGNPVPASISIDTLIALSGEVRSFAAEPPYLGGDRDNYTEPTFTLTPNCSGGGELQWTGSFDIQGDPTSQESYTFSSQSDFNDCSDTAYTDGDTYEVTVRGGIAFLTDADVKHSVENGTDYTFNIHQVNGDPISSSFGVCIHVTSPEDFEFCEFGSGSVSIVDTSIKSCEGSLEFYDTNGTIQTIDICSYLSEVLSNL